MRLANNRFYAALLIVVAVLLAARTFDVQASSPAPARVEEIRQSKCNFSSEEGCTSSIILTYIKQGARPLSKQSLRIAQRVAKKKGLRIVGVEIFSIGGYIINFDKYMTNNQMFLVGQEIVSADPDGLSTQINFRSRLPRILKENKSKF